MSLNDVMTPLMDKARKLTGLTDKIGIARLTGLMDHFNLHVNPNLLKETTIVIKKETYSLGDLGTLKTGEYTFSWSAKTSGSNHYVRIRPFCYANNTELSKTSGGDVFPLTDHRQSYTFNVPNDGKAYNLLIYGFKGADGESETDKDVTIYDCKLETGDLATPLEKVGGGN